MNEKIQQTHNKNEKKSWQTRAKLFGISILGAFSMSGFLGLKAEASSVNSLDEQPKVEKISKVIRVQNECKSYIQKTALVNLRAQSMKICENNRVISRSNILSGREDGPTPTGKFNIEKVEYNKDLIGRNYGRKYSRGQKKDWRDYKVKVDQFRSFNGPSYGFHSGDTSGRIAKLRGERVGSRGCVRVQNTSTLNKLTLGTPVNIYY